MDGPAPELLTCPNCRYCVASSADRDLCPECGQALDHASIRLVAERLEAWAAIAGDEQSRLIGEVTLLGVLTLIGLLLVLVMALMEIGTRSPDNQFAEMVAWMGVLALGVGLVLLCAVGGARGLARLFDARRGRALGAVWLRASRVALLGWLVCLAAAPIQVSTWTERGQPHIGPVAWIALVVSAVGVRYTWSPLLASVGEFRSLRGRWVRRLLLLLLLVGALLGIASGTLVVGSVTSLIEGYWGIVY